jgi:hypothetical protein
MHVRCVHTYSFWLVTSAYITEEGVPFVSFGHTHNSSLFCASGECVFFVCECSFWLVASLHVTKEGACLFFCIGGLCLSYECGSARCACSHGDGSLIC